VICPVQGAAKITPPSGSTPTSYNSTGGTVITLPEKALYFMIDSGSSGAAANLPFPAWSIADIYPGCGVFFKYGITSDLATLSYLQYPEPGLTLANCIVIGACLNVRVINTSPRVLTFNLQLFPQYGGDPVSIPYVVDVTPCRQATFSVPTNPSDLVITRSATASSFQEFSYSPTYANIFSNSEPTNCPVLAL
jgi:hypothetical protein